MKKSIVLCSILAGIMLFQACNYTSATIKNVKMCNQLNGDACSENVNVFSTDDPQFALSCDVTNAPSDTKITFAWFYIEADERLEIDVVSVTLPDAGTYPLHSSLSAPNAGWPTGNYEVVISIDGFEDKTITHGFRVR